MLWKPIYSESKRSLTVATSLMSEHKDIKKVATGQQLKHVTNEKQVGYQLSLRQQRNREVQNERAAKATITREHLSLRLFDAFASLTSAITKTIVGRPEREMQGPSNARSVRDANAAGQEPRKQDDTQHAGSDCEHHESLKRRSRRGLMLSRLA